MGTKRSGGSADGGLADENNSQGRDFRAFCRVGRVVPYFLHTRAKWAAVKNVNLGGIGSILAQTEDGGWYVLTYDSEYGGETDKDETFRLAAKEMKDTFELMRKQD